MSYPTVSINGTKPPVLRASNSGQLKVAWTPPAPGTYTVLVSIAEGWLSSSVTATGIGIINGQKVCGPTNGARQLCKIGATGPGGGPIFFVDYFDQYPGFDYLEAAPDNVLYAVPWCDNTTTSIPAVNGWAAGAAVGNGQANTTAMLGTCTSGAANAADSYVSPNGTADYFLPTLGEMAMMENSLKYTTSVGKIAPGRYWTSTGLDSTSAVRYGVADPSIKDPGAGAFPTVKFIVLAVRPVRAF
jgi:hypothetical protein